MIHQASTWFVVGATSEIGFTVISNLTKAEFSVISFVNTKTQNERILEELYKVETKMVFGDLTIPDTYEKYLATCDVVIYCIPTSVANLEKVPFHVGISGIKLLADKMIEYGVTRIIFCSSTEILWSNEQEFSKVDDRDFRIFDDLSRFSDVESFLKSKNGELSVTIIRFSLIFGEIATEPLIELAEFLGQKVIIKTIRGNPTISFIHLADVADLILVVGSASETPSSTYNVQSFSVKISELVNMGELVFQKKIIQIPLPSPLTKLFYSLKSRIKQLPRNYFAEISVRNNLSLSFNKITNEIDWTPSHFNISQLELILEEYVLNRKRKITTLEYNEILPTLPTS